MLVKQKSESAAAAILKDGTYKATLSLSLIHI